MSAHSVVVDGLLAAAVAITVLSVFGAVVLRTTYGKLHYVTPVTSAAAPLFLIAIVVDTGWGITAGLDILIVGLLAVSGPVLQASIGRLEAQRRGRLQPEEPP